MNLVKAVLLSILISFTAGVARAQDTLDLSRFYNMKTYVAQFDQVLLDDSFNPIEESSGSMMIKRPGRFRWDYDPPNEQKIISDGDRVVVYDIELEQITIRALDRAMGRTPAGLLAGGTDLDSEFEVTDLGLVNGPLHWVRMVPRDSDGSYEDIRVGFEDGGLRVMELVDGLGQVTRITLTDTRENIEIPDSSFDFEPPSGVDVIDETG